VSDKYLDDHKVPWTFRQEPKALLDGRAYVINLGDKRGPGTHWTAGRLTKSALYYADPFGTVLKGWPPKEIKKLAELRGVPTVVNSVCWQQPDTALCGYYAMLFTRAMDKFPDSRVVNQKEFEAALLASVN